MSAKNPWSGLFLLNKPRGVTSFSIVAQIRKLTGLRKVGHTGTLDPFAEGLLLVCCGKATVTASFLEALDKTYLAGIEFGTATDTQDLTGEVIELHELSPDERENIAADNFSLLRQAVEEMQGDIFQLPPMYSAVKVNGRPLYKYARQGEVIERKKRSVHIYKSELIFADLQEKLRAQIHVECSKGTYIRTLADDLGRHLGFFAHAFSLTRLACGKYNIEQSIEPGKLFTLQEERANQEDLIDFLRQQGCYIPLDAIFNDSDRLMLDLSQAKKLILGQKLSLDRSQVQSALLKGDVTGDYDDCGTDIYPLAFYYRQQLIALGKLIAEENGWYRVRTERVVKEIADIH